MFRPELGPRVRVVHHDQAPPRGELDRRLQTPVALDQEAGIDQEMDIGVEPIDQVISIDVLAEQEEADERCDRLLGSERAGEDGDVGPPDAQARFDAGRPDTCLVITCPCEEVANPVDSRCVRRADHDPTSLF
jgi:hypothetical protein